MNEHAFPLVEVSGTSYEMGHQHGAQARELIHRYIIWIEKLTGKPKDVLCRNAMAFLPLIESLSPSYIEEVRGLAEGASIGFDEAMLCQSRAEDAQVPEGGCSAFALTGARRHLLTREPVIEVVEGVGPVNATYWGCSTVARCRCLSGKDSGPSRFFRTAVGWLQSRRRDHRVL